MYLEFIYIIVDYSLTLNRRIFLYEWVIPFAIGITAGVLSFLYSDTLLYDIIENSVQIIVTLLGFTLATLTLFLTGNSKIEETKKYIIPKKIRGKNISLYRFIVISYSYLIILETLLCIGYYIAKLFPYMTNVYACLIINILFISLMLNLLFTTIRSITDLYFIITKEV